MPARLAQHLVTQGLLSIETVEEASRHQTLAGGRLDTALLERGVVAEAGMLQALGDVAQAKPVNLADFEPNREAAVLLPGEVAQRLCVVPLSVDGDMLHVASGYPIARAELDELQPLLGRKLEIWVALEARIREWQAALYGLALGARYRALLVGLDPGRPLLVPSVELLQEELSLEEKLAYELGAVLPEPLALTVRKTRSAARVPVSTAPAEPTRVLETPLPIPKEAVREDQQPTRVLLSPLAAASAPPAASAPDTALPPSLVVFAPPSAPAEPPLGLQALASLQPPSRVEVRATQAAVIVQAPVWSLEQARAALRQASRDRDEIIHVALRYALGTFHHAVAFAVLRGVASYWEAVGEGAFKDTVAEVSIPLDAPSLFGTVAKSRASFIGPVPNDALTRQYLALLGRNPRSAFLFPVEVKGRLVCLVYGDAGKEPISQRRLSDFLLFCQQLPEAFAQLLVEKKRRLGPLAGRAPVGPEPKGGSGTETTEGWTVHSVGVAGPGRTAGMPGLLATDELAAPDFAPLLQKLTGPDPVARARALADLCRTPKASALRLAQHFPGPVAWSRLPVVELPEAEELGPVPAALARLGRSGAQALVSLLDDERPDIRYFALLTAGNVPFPEVVSGVLRGLFDPEPDVSSAARAAATALQRQPRFEAALPDLRKELDAAEALRRVLAARALGVLRDKTSVPKLVQWVASEDGMCAEAAVEALREITKRSMGVDATGWATWWAAHQNLSRAAWLVEGLRDEALDVRLSAIEELAAVVNDTLGYVAGAPPHERERSVHRWEAALRSNPRLGSLG